MGPPSPFSHIRTQTVEGRGLLSSKNWGFHAGVAWEEDAMPGPTWVCGSWITIPPVGRGGVWMATSPGPEGGWSATFCFFQARLAWEEGGGGGTWLQPWEGRGWVGCRVPGTKRSMVMTFLVTMSSPRWVSVTDKLVASSARCSASATGFSGSTGFSG